MCTDGELRELAPGQGGSLSRPWRSQWAVTIVTQGLNQEGP